MKTQTLLMATALAVAMVVPARADGLLGAALRRATAAAAGMGIPMGPVLQEPPRRLRRDCDPARLPDRQPARWHRRGRSLSHLCADPACLHVLWPACAWRVSGATAVAMSNVVPLLREEVAPKRQTPLRKPNAELRTREHLTEPEVEKLIEAAKGNRHGHRDATMILVAFRHGLRASELCDCVGPGHFSSATLHVRRRKDGQRPHPSAHRARIAGPAPPEARAGATSPFVFVVGARRAVLDRGLRPHAAARRQGRRAGVQGASAHAAACLRLQAGQRRARHPGAAGYLGHKNIQHTVRYTELAPGRFKDFWRD